MSEEITQNWERDALREVIKNLQKTQKSERRWRFGVRIFRSIGFICLMLFLISLTSQTPVKATSTHTAYINIKGELAAGSLADADHLIPSIHAAFENPNAKAVVLRINSPGGSPVQAGRIYEEIQAQKQNYPEKRVIAIIDDVGASGGYYIAVAADEIYADKASMVGSIGVISSSFGFTGLMSKLGIERRALTSGDNKALLDPFSPLSDDMKAFWKEVLAKTHEQFIQRVKEGRGQRLKDQPEVFSGLLWNGEQALELGLIDGLGSLHSVSRNLIGAPELVDYSPNEDFMGRLTSQARIQASTFIDEIASLRVY